MEITQLNTSHHARQRQACRNLSDADVHFVLEHGQRLYRAGAMHVFLGRRDIPRERTIYQRYARLEGTVLVICVDHADAILITAYRNRRALKAIRTKARYDRQEQHTRWAA